MTNATLNGRSAGDRIRVHLTSGSAIAGEVLQITVDVLHLRSDNQGAAGVTKILTSAIVAVEA